jgi:hypothetical protein
MLVHPAEQLDGLGDMLKNNSIAMTCEIVEQGDIKEISDELKKALASVNDRPLQKDLYYLNSILVSAGWNKNDDVFDVADLWAARDTPVDKPFNYMHEETDIIGHMISSAAINEDGTLINSDISDLPERMDIVTSAVIYKTWADTAQADRINNLIQQIDQGELAVSMECVFRNFDYALISPDGSHEVIARTEDSAFLTKHLRAYGGSGTYEGYQVGRILRDLFFSGKGLVDKPANPRSKILSRDVNPFKPDTNSFSTLAMEIKMPEENSALASATADLGVAKAALEIATANVSSLTAEIDTHKATIDALQTKVSELEGSIATITEEKMTVSQELQKMVADVKALSRKSALIGAGATEEKADELLTKFAEASDEMFEMVVALIVPAPVEVETEVEAEVETTEEVDETEALDSVTDVETPVTVVEEDAVVARISSASQWLRENVLTSKSK